MCLASSWIMCIDGRSRKDHFASGLLLRPPKSQVPEKNKPKPNKNNNKNLDKINQNAIQHVYIQAPVFRKDYRVGIDGWVAVCI